MNSFRNLVQNKRKKMLYLAVLLVILPFLSVGETINLTYILKKDGNVLQPSCVAEEFERYAAVGWVYPIPTNEKGIPDITTKFIPTIENNYNCKFSKNDICSSRKTWSPKDWIIEESYDFLADLRWEDLPTIFISNITNEVNRRIEVSKVFKSGISVRAGETIELLICNGWNPYTYPCYYFNMGISEVYLNRYAMLPKVLRRGEIEAASLKHYKAYSPILSHDEWRNFVVSFDENNTLKLFDVNLNRTIIEHIDEDPLKPAYLIMRSNNGSLWKIHKNEFLYTNTTQISRLGPQLTVTNKDLCVSLLITTCPNCVMRFFYSDGVNTKDLKTVAPMQGGEWMEIKLKEENIPIEKLQLFIETKFKDNSPEGMNGFWAVDNIRVCNENEVKVSFLRVNNTVNAKEIPEEYISCQLIKMPSWRPKQLTYNNIQDLPNIDYIKDSTFIRLYWTQQDPQNQIRYFISYKGNDNCTTEPHNLKRTKSDGFLTTKLNEIVLDNLEPFTVYNITMSTVLHEEDKRIQIKTLETVEPTLEELPKRIKILPSEVAVYVSWAEVDCTEVYGRLVYMVTVTNDMLSFAKSLEYRTENHYEIDGLQPYTTYTLNITTARRAVDINNGKHSSSAVFNFTTLPGVAAPVENLELYSMDETSASLRYDLPKYPRGAPSEIQIIRCNILSFQKCKIFIQRITRCPLWPQKYCITVNNLPEYVNIRVSLKNLRTPGFGTEVSVKGHTQERVPGAPTNVTYKVVDCDNYTDYCNLNVSWVHPYYENGTITSFNIILNSTNMSKNSEEDIYIHEVYKVENKTYLPLYTHQIKIVPYSTTYILHLNSANTMYRSNYTSTIVKTDHIGDHINQKPILLEKSDSTLTFRLPTLDRRLDGYSMTILVQDFNRSMTVDPKVLDNNKVKENLCHSFGETWIAQVLTVKNNDTEKITIGNFDKVIKPKTKYCITFIITNRYKESEHDVVYYEKLETPEASENPEAPGRYNHLYVLLLLLLLVPIGFLIYRYLRKRRIIKKPTENNENVYESMPFDDCDTNCVSNENYDKLLHND